MQDRKIDFEMNNVKVKADEIYEDLVQTYAENKNPVIIKPELTKEIFEKQ